MTLSPGKSDAGSSFVYHYIVLYAGYHSREEMVAYTLDEHFRKEYNIVDFSISVTELRPRMVLSHDGKFKVVIWVQYDKSETGAVMSVRTGEGVIKFAADATLIVWYMNGKPFLMVLPPEEPLDIFPIPRRGGGTPPTQHDAVFLPPGMAPAA